MVVFTCNQCGEALKKAQVEKHFQSRCRNCNVLSCLDCGKDFMGNEYEQHTQCISEEQKYSGKNFVAKANANKGALKQQQWTQQVQNAIDKCQANPSLKRLLMRMKDYSNIPRAKKKFENFVKNSLGERNQKLVADVWELLMANTETTKKVLTPQPQTSATNGSDQSQTTVDEAANENSEMEQTDLKKLSKREKKEERKKKSHKSEKKEKTLNGSNTEENEKKDRKKKKSKKRQLEEVDDEETEDVISGKKRKLDVSEVAEEDVDEDVDDNNSAEVVKKQFKTKFDWNQTILDVLQPKGEMKIKKIRKKVLAEYLSQGCTEKSEEKLWARFDKKMKKNPAVKILNDRVKLKL